jgi:predicted metal-dependent HD superfamily phosphohydrolase
MTVATEIPTIAAILERYSADLGPDRLGYTNHVLRVANFFRGLSGADTCPEHVLIAAAFHDLGIWTAGTFDYLDPSVKLARVYLDDAGRSDVADEVEAMIVQHHKLRPYRGPFAATVEQFRRADLVDVSLGIVRFGLPRGFVRSVCSALPDAGFHRRLIELGARQFVREPLRPLPMLRW